jgi:hypothetical protein
MTLKSPNSTNNDLQVSFNLLKNKFNTLLDRSKNDLTITQIPTQPDTHTTIQSITNIPITNQDIAHTHNTIKHQFSTPISQIKKQQMQSQNQQSNNTQSNNTPTESHTLFRDNNIDIQEVKFNEDGNESVSGSDVASVMDLDDFEKSL